MFETRRWLVDLSSGNKTTITHRDMNSKSGVKFEWMISQNYGKNRVKLTNEQMKELIDLVERWEYSKYEEARYEEAKY